MKNYMLLRESIGELVQWQKNLKAGNKQEADKYIKRAAKKLGIVAVLQPLAVGLIREGFNELRGANDDDESFLRKWALSMLNANLGMFPLIGSAIGGFVSVYGTSGIVRSHPLFEEVKNVANLTVRLGKYATTGEVNKEALMRDVRKSLAGLGIAYEGPTQMVEMVNTILEEVEQ